MQLAKVDPAPLRLPQKSGEFPKPILLAARNPLLLQPKQRLLRHARAFTANDGQQHIGLKVGRQELVLVVLYTGRQSVKIEPRQKGRRRMQQLMRGRVPDFLQALVFANHRLLDHDGPSGWARLRRNLLRRFYLYQNCYL